MEEQVTYPDLLTVNEAERRLAVCRALEQLAIVGETFASGQLQPHLQNDFRVGYDILPGRHFGMIVTPYPQQSSTNKMHGFATGFNHSYAFGDKIGYEIDATGNDLAFKVGPAFIAEEMIDIHDDAFPGFAKRRTAVLRAKYSEEEFCNRKLPLNYTDSFITLAATTYKYAAKRLIRAKRSRSSYID